MHGYLLSITFLRVAAAPAAKILKGDIMKDPLPGMVLIGYVQGGQLMVSCGGHFVGKRHVLTAWHCFEDGLLGMSAFWGGVDQNNVASFSSAKLESPTWPPGEVYANRDIALVKIKGERKNADGAGIPDRDYVSLTEENKKRALGIFGWGRTSYGGSVSRYLKSALIHLSKCSRAIEQWGGEYKLGSSDFCAGGGPDGGVDACQGDSGGPVLVQNMIVGVVSRGIGCGEYTGVYTSVYHHREWIKRETGVGVATTTPSVNAGSTEGAAGGISDGEAGGTSDGEGGESSDGEGGGLPWYFYGILAVVGVIAAIGLYFLCGSGGKRAQDDGAHHGAKHRPERTDNTTHHKRRRAEKPERDRVRLTTRKCRETSPRGKPTRRREKL